MKKLQKRWMGMVLISLTSLILGACAAGVDTSKSYSRAVINRGAIVSADTIRVNEYLNYYEQRFPEPVDQPLGLDLRLGNPVIPAKGDVAWLQIGIQARTSEQSFRTPLNLALVLDVSGSMADGGKMDYLKRSLEVFLPSLDPDDIVGIVAFSNDAEVIRNSAPVGDGHWIRQAVNSLYPTRSTNLNAGLMLGFQLVEDHFDLRRNNRVILLTDGIANRGVTDPERIAASALAYNQQGIYLSTIGLGYDLDDVLLSTLARQGHGAYHFVDSPEEMDKIFRVEVEGLVERVANDVRVTIDPAPGVSLHWVSGLESLPPSGGAEIVTIDMGAGDNQVILAQLHVAPGTIGEKILAEITLRYEDAFAQRQQQISLPVIAKIIQGDAYYSLADVEVRRNATIVASAEALREIDKLFNQGRYQQAWELAYEMEWQLRAVASLTGDPQLVEDADLFQRYQLTLVEALGYNPDEALDRSKYDWGDVEQRWGIDTDFPTVEVR
jgi:Ca-activated chloride channel family protein